MSKTRESWGSTISFILACIGYAVGLGNIWRFPYLAYKSGGGAFLIPYLVMLILCGLPLLYMELVVGQYTRRGPIGALRQICPLLSGAGIATVIMSFLLSTYYNVIMAWVMFYFVYSFSSPLPWTHCNNEWNTPKCRSSSINETHVDAMNDTETSSQQFYDLRVLNKSSGIEHMGSLNLELFGLLVVAWVIVYFCLWKSVRATGKVVYFTATIPLVLLVIFTIRGVTLPGASDGLLYFFKPVWREIFKPKVWVYAAAQVFNSIGIAFGSLIAFASYNDFNGPILKNTLIVVLIDAVVCIVCGVCVFATMGNLALTQGTTVEKVVTQGPGLLFVVYPHALSQLPVPQVWSVLFFGMLICLGIDSQFAIVEVVITSIKDEFGDLFNRYIRRHEILVLIVCAFTLLCGIPHTFQGGIYLFQLMDYYTAAISLMFIALFETVAVVWFYGVDRLSSNIQDMTGGSGPNILVKICLRFISPLLILIIWVFSLYDYKAPSYGTYNYPLWCIGLGWFIASLSLVPIPVQAIVTLLRAKGGLKAGLTSTIQDCPCCEKPFDSNQRAHCDIKMISTYEMT